MNQETIVIDGVRYYADRPNSCRGCFFWKNRKAGCSLKKENCYYLAESSKQTTWASVIMALQSGLCPHPMTNERGAFARYPQRRWSWFSPMPLP